MGSRLERDIVRGFPMQGWMVVMLAILTILIVCQWWERR
jgi:hypothetical protein